MSELSAFAGSEGYGACPDEANALRRLVGAVAGGSGKPITKRETGPEAHAASSPVFLLLYIFDNVLHPAVKDPTEVVNLRRGNSLFFPQALNGCAADPILMNQCICGNVFFLQRSPKWSISNHTIHPAFL